MSVASAHTSAIPTTGATAQYCAFTAPTPDGDFTVITAAEGILASGWTADLEELLLLVHQSLRPQLADVYLATQAEWSSPMEESVEDPVADSVSVWGQERGFSAANTPVSGPTRPSSSGQGASGHRDMLVSAAGEAGSGTAVQHAAAARAALAAYYAGDIAAPGRVAVVQASGPFREHAWDVLRGVAPGEIVTYTEYAERTGRPKAVRAAASACAMNAAALFVPCHRVLRSDGSLGGFRYGLAVKQSLLAREGEACSGS